MICKEKGYWKGLEWERGKSLESGVAGNQGWLWTSTPVITNYLEGACGRAGGGCAKQTFIHLLNHIY